MAHTSRRSEDPSRRRTRWWAVGTLFALVVAGAAVSGTRSATTDQPPFDQAHLITDAQGNALTLRGFSASNSSKSAPDGLPELSTADIDRERTDMGTNFVRFLISWRSVEPAPGVYDQNYLDEVAERVDWYGDRGYHVMLDMHQDLYGPGAVPHPNLGNGAPEWATHTDGLQVTDHDMWELYYAEPGVVRAYDNFWNLTGEHPELRTHYVNSWKAVAERFAGNDVVVAYDLYNEPYGGSLQGPAFEAGPLTELYQDATDAIRTVDESTWLCLEPQAIGVNWGTPSALGRIDDPRAGDPRIAYCPHLYPLPMDVGGGYVGPAGALVDGTIDTWLGNTLRTAEHLGTVPVILGEFGLDTTLPGALDYVNAVYDMADQNGFAVAYWARDPGDWGPYDDDGNPRNLVSALDRPYPRAVSGRVGDIAAGARSLEFAVDPDGDNSATVYLPAGFGGGPGTGAIPDFGVDGAQATGWDGDLRILELTVDPDATRVSIGPASR